MGSMLDINSTSRGNALTPKGATHYHAHLGLLVKDHDVKGLVVCYLVWLGSRFMGWVFGPAQGARVWSFVVVRMAIELKYRSTP